MVEIQFIQKALSVNSGICTTPMHYALKKSTIVKQYNAFRFLTCSIVPSVKSIFKRNLHQNERMLRNWVKLKFNPAEAMLWSASRQFDFKYSLCSIWLQSFLQAGYIKLLKDRTFSLVPLFILLAIFKLKDKLNKPQQVIFPHLYFISFHFLLKYYFPRSLNNSQSA